MGIKEKGEEESGLIRWRRFMHVCKDVEAEEIKREREKRSLFLGHGSLFLSRVSLSRSLRELGHRVEASAHAYIRTWYSRDSD